MRTVGTMYEKTSLLKLGQRIKARRNELGMYQRELAEACGYSHASAICGIEGGEWKDFHPHKLKKIADALHTSVENLTDGVICTDHLVNSITFGLKVRLKRIELGLTQQELARKIHYSSGRIRSIEEGITPYTLSISSSTILRFSQALEASPSFFTDSVINPVKTEYNRKDFGKRLKKRRIELGLTPRYLARMIDTSTVTIYNWESNYRFPKSEKVNKLAKVLDVPYSYFCDAEETSCDISVNEQAVKTV